MTKHELLKNYSYEVFNVIKWIKQNTKKSLKKYKQKQIEGYTPYPPILMEQIPGLFDTNNNFVCIHTYIEKFKELKINFKNPNRHKELRKYLIS